MGRSLHPKCGWDYSLGRKGGDTQGQSRLCARVCCSLFPDVSPCCLDFPTTVGCTLTLLVKINLLFWVVFGCVPNLVFKNQFIHVLYIIYSSCTHLPTKLRLLGVLLKPWEKASNTKAKSFLHKRKKNRQQGGILTQLEKEEGQRRLDGGGDLGQWPYKQRRRPQPTHGTEMRYFIAKMSAIQHR